MRRMSRRDCGAIKRLGRRRKHLPALEFIEGRLLPAALVEPPSISSRDGVLRTTLTEMEGVTTIDGRSVDGSMTYNGVYAGVTLKAQPGDLLDLTLVNRLSTFTSNLHTHGLHVSPVGNGDNVLLQVDPGESQEYRIPIPKDHPQGMYWYHPHVHGSVDQQIRSGLSGMLVIGRADGGAPELAGFDDVLLGLKTLTTPSASGYLPMLTGLDSSANYAVNGQIDPTLTMAPGEIKVWNVANLSRDSSFRLQLDGHQLYVVALDGNPLTTPRAVDYVDVGAAGRVSFMVKASSTPGDYTFRTLGFQDGDRTFAAESLVTLKVQGAPAGDVLPTSLTPPSNYYQDLGGATPAAERTIEFGEDSASLIYGVNGQTFPNVPTIVARLNTVEEWTLVNDTYQIHPFHIHQNGFQVMSVNGEAIPADGTPTSIASVARYVAGFSTVVDPSAPPQSQQYIGGTLVDTVNIPAKDPVTGEPGRVVVRMKFDDFLGQFVYHCHVPFHEDHGMMGLVQIVPEAPTYAVGANAGELPRVRVFDPVTNQVVGDFLAYEASYRGGVNVTTADVNGDGVNDVIVGRARGLPQVKVIDGRLLRRVDPATKVIARGALLGNFLAFGRNVRGVSVAAGYFDGDDRADIVVGAGDGSDVRVVAASRINVVGPGRRIRPDALLHDFSTSPGRSRGGVAVAAGDVNGDGLAEVVVGAGRGAEPWVRVFGGAGLDQIDEFLAYDATERGGVSVATGNVKGYAYADIVTGSGSSPLVKVWSLDSDEESTDDMDADDMDMSSGSTFAEVDAFNAYSRLGRRGVRVATFVDPELLSPYGSSRYDVATTRAAGSAWPVRSFGRTIKPSGTAYGSMSH